MPEEAESARFQSDARGERHEQPEGENSADGERDTRQPLKEKAITKQDHIGELGRGGDAGKSRACRRPKVTIDEAKGDRRGDGERKGEGQQVNEVSKEKLEGEATRRQEEIVHRVKLGAEADRDHDKDGEEKEQGYRRKKSHSTGHRAGQGTAGMSMAIALAPITSS